MLLGLWLVLLPSHAEGRQVTGIVISYSLATNPLTLREPVVLTFTVKNSTKGTVTFDLGQDRKGNYEFWITPPNGMRLKLPQYGHEGMSRVGRLSIEPGETFSQDLILNEWFKFEDVGSYVLQGRLTQPFVVDAGREEQADPGFRATIDIKPRDEARLISTCDSLADQIDHSSGYEQWAQAALALSYVDDPVAVPYLRRALFARKLVEPIAIRGLETIGDDESVRALASATDADLPGLTATLARRALQRIGEHTTDPARKEAIREILQKHGDH